MEEDGDPPRRGGQLLHAHLLTARGIPQANAGLRGRGHQSAIRVGGQAEGVI
jgi:hypothetical protein